MNTKRIIFWICFLTILALILWGLGVAMTRKAPGSDDSGHGTPPPITSSDHVQGPANAPVTLIEYSDFQCPACENVYFTVTKLLKEASSSIRFVYRHFPLYPLPHKNALNASIASEAAGAQGKFWEMYDELFTNHTDWTELDDPTPIFVGYAKKIGLDTAKFTADLKNDALKNKILADLQGGQDIGINATPSFFVNGKFITNPQKYAEFKAIIDEAVNGGTN